MIGLNTKCFVLFFSLFWTLAGWVIPDNAESVNLPLFHYEHTPPDGFIANQQTTISLSLSSNEKVSDVRLYFRPFSLKEFVFIELSSNNEAGYTGVIPAFVESVNSLEYLFLWKVGGRKIVRTSPKILFQTMKTPKAQIAGVKSVVFTEIDYNGGDDFKRLVRSAAVNVSQVPDKLHWGMRAGLFDMSKDQRYRFGYFGGYLYEPDKDVTFAIEGYLKFAPLIDRQLKSRALDQSLLSQTPQGYPNVAGDDWSGVFYRTDSSSRTNITAVITHDGEGGVTLTTTLSGRGNYLAGSISSGQSGDLYMIDHWDDEIWTTHDLPESTSVYFGIEDYVYKPSGSNPDPPLWRIELTRPEPKVPVDWLPSILIPLLLN